MPTLYAHTNDGYVARWNQSSWSNARNNASGTAVASTGVGHFAGIQGARTASRGGGNVYHIYRSFFYFDTSAISSNVDSATLKIRGYSNTGGDVIALKSNSDIETLGTGDFNAIEGWNTTTDGSGGGDNGSSVTKYSNEITSWSNSGYVDIALNAQALADMRDDNTVYIALVNFDYDLKDIEPTGFSTHRNGLYYTNYGGTSRDPYIDFTLAAITTNTSIFFGTNF